MLWLERTDLARVALDDPDLVTGAVEAAITPPHPWVQLSDEWGNLLRLEGSKAGCRLQAREVGSDGVRWSGLGTAPPPGTQTHLHLAGRTVKVAPTEVLDSAAALAALRAFAADGRIPEDLARRPLTGDHGRMYLMAVGTDEPRPVMGWADVARRLGEVEPEAGMVAALSEPGRVLIGIFGQGDAVTVTVQESRGPRTYERRVEQLEGAGAPRTVRLPGAELTVPARQILSRADAATAVESLYRFDAPPPGFGWALRPV